MGAAALDVPVNPVLQVVQEVVAEHSNVLPPVFSITLPSELWAALWAKPIKGTNGKPLEKCARIRFQPGGFHVFITEEATGDPPQDEVH